MDAHGISPEEARLPIALSLSPEWVDAYKVLPCS
jgi:hypothetical protein